MDIIVKKLFYPQKFLYHWPDGIFIRNIININKIPGRDIIKKIKLKKNIKSIKVIGNISNKSKIYLKKLFKLKIYHEKLPYGPIEKLLKKNIKIKKSQIIFITLPTPKQEQLAYKLAQRSKNLKLFVLVVQLQLQVVKKNKFLNF